MLFNHGSGHSVLGAGGERPMEWQAETVAPAFVRHGYVFLYPLRRGTGLSAREGQSSSDRWDSAFAAGGQEARNQLQLELMESVELDDVLAALAFLRTVRDVDPRRVVVAGHSFGGSLTLLAAERDSALRAAVVFAANDFSVGGGRALAAEMTRRGKPHRLAIYPAVDDSARAGHSLVHLRVSTWEPDVLAWLDRLTARR